MTAVHLSFTRKINPLPFYLRGALVRHPGLMPGERLPEMKAEWQGFRIDPGHFRKVTALCGLVPGTSMPLIYPKTFLFPLHMSIISRREFPFPYLKMLHVRDHILQRRVTDISEQMDVCCIIDGQRILAKGLEIDIRSVISAAGKPAWECISTYFFPGSFGEPEAPSPLAVFDPIPEEYISVEWTMPDKNRFRFGLLTGDYNGIHYSAPYARMMGFKRDFSHAQRTTAECLRRLPSLQEEGPVRLSLALKGPVYYGTRVSMKYAAFTGGFRFDLYVKGLEKPSIMAVLCRVGTDAMLTEIPGETMQGLSLQGGKHEDH